MASQKKVRVIIVTDGDVTAQKAIKTAAHDLNLYPLMMSGGNPTPLTGEKILELILKAPYDPVVVMADDKGFIGRGYGEQVIDFLMSRDEIQVLGVIAVASDTKVYGVEVDCSINADGQVVRGPVNKYGYEEKAGNKRLEGDTVEVLKKYPEVFVVGCGDIGKNEDYDSVEYGAFITSRALQEILERRTPFV
ncbi:MAG: stage V sporulation protein AE [Syntrophomonadaceae bacterium]|nr:stage V sporulation protein AE [Syntrophomonadaceae bacterium]